VSAPPLLRIIAVPKPGTTPLHHLLVSNSCDVIVGRRRCRRLGHLLRPDQTRAARPRDRAVFHPAQSGWLTRELPVDVDRPDIGSDYEPVILRAYELYRELVEESGQTDIMVKTGFLDLAPHRNFPAYQLPHNRRSEDLSIQQVKERFPQFQIGEPYWGAYDPEGALLRPEVTITTYVRLAMQRGAHILGNTKVLDWKSDAGGVTVITDRETHTADRIVFCAGPRTGKLIMELGIAVTVTRMSFAWVWPLTNFKAYEPESLPCWCIEDEDGIYYGFPMMSDVPGYKIGLHRYGETVDPDSFNRTPNAQDEEFIRKGLRRYFPRRQQPRGCPAHLPLRPHRGRRADHRPTPRPRPRDPLRPAVRSGRQVHPGPRRDRRRLCRERPD